MEAASGSSAMSSCPGLCIEARPAWTSKNSSTVIMDRINLITPSGCTMVRVNQGRLHTKCDVEAHHKKYHDRYVCNGNNVNQVN